MSTITAPPSRLTPNATVRAGLVLSAIIGLATLVWIRFIRFPPFLAAYEQRMARERYFTKQKYTDPEATIRKRGGRPQQRQRRRRR